ncbi:fatty-acid-binding protein 1-like isoform X2 [Gossypium australe]|uniref:Fatty-acid-binding protein 1-like isoform X2 n=1 Tax=Gossypium australe TaxID=47621 RepID=A0A5B6UTK9_9ROSI|nr:fatty-acid-binding protein 1-like isoform X2 [Gossypium australe]
MATSSENTIAKAAQEATNDEKETNGTEEVAVEPKTGVSFPVKLDDGKQLNCVGMYADNEKLKDLLKSKIGKAPEKPTKELYQMVIDSDVEMW